MTASEEKAARLRSIAEGAAASHEHGQALATAALLAGEMELAASLITRYIEPNMLLRLTVSDLSPSSSPFVKWTIGRDNRSSFVFASHIFRSDSAEADISRWLRTLPLFARVNIADAELPAVNVSLGDYGRVEGLAYCGNHPDVLLIPDPVFIESRAYAETRAAFVQAPVPWEARKPMALWRGATSGVPEPREDGWRALPRVKLCEIGRTRPEVIDAALTGIVQIGDDRTREEIASSGLMELPLPISHLSAWRYQIDIDGNSNSWSGLFQKLLSGSVVLKVTSPCGYRQWYYERLKPWVHFVPVAADLSDLIEKIEWLRANDARAREIGECGRELACSMTLEGELDGAVGTVEAAFRNSVDRPPAVVRRTVRTCQPAVMRALHGEDVWRDYVPRGPRQDAIEGWNGMYPPFKSCLVEAPNKVFVDVGVWKGQSTIFVAEFMRESAMDGCVIAIDTFLGSVEHYDGKREFFQRIHGRPDLYETFLDNVWNRNLADLVVPLPQTSVTAALLLKRRSVRVGVVHLDASHEYEDTLRDAELYWPLIESGGFLIGDDYHESWPGVVRAAQEFTSSRGLELNIRMPKWIVRKP